MSFEAVEASFEQAVAEGVFPGAVLLVAKEGQVLLHRAFGHRSVLPEPTPLDADLIYDLSSLTKPLATTTAFLLLAREGKLRLDDRVSRLFHNFGLHGKTQITYRHLLTHSSGLPAWKPYYETVRRLDAKGRVNFLCSPAGKGHVYEMIRQEKLEAPTGTKVIYSDLGFALLGEAIEAASGTPLDRFCRDRIFGPLGMRSTSYVDLSALRSRRLRPITEAIAPTEDCPWRKKILCGEVHDDNAYAMGGVAGHSGVFSSARDVHLLVSALLDAYEGIGALLPQALVREAFEVDASVPGSTRTLGWDTPSPVDSSAGSKWPRARSVGHLGFTGTSIWIDLERKIHVILLTNRVHPRRDNDAIRAFRPRIHDQILEAIGA